MSEGVQGRFFFSGIQGVLQASFTLGLGTVPSVCNMYIPPQRQRLPEVGMLQLQYGGVNLLFPDARLIDSQFARDPDGREVWSLSIADHRWRWQFGHISGNYNTRLDNQKFRQDTKLQKPQELAKLCLDAMGEKADIRLLDNTQYPEVQWEYTRPSAALEELIEPLNCRVRMINGNQVSLVRLNEGLDLPDGSDVLFGSDAINPAERPDSLRFVAGRTLWQYDFPLEMVGLERDGNIVPVDKLSYTPTGAGKWIEADIPNFQCVKDLKCRELAHRSVFKWYRLKTPFKLPGGITVKDLWRVLPISDRQVQEQTVLGKKEAMAALVLGEYYRGNTKIENNTKNLAADIKLDPKIIYDGDFNIDTERGLVMFSDFVYGIGDFAGQAGGRKQAAKLVLRTSVGLRDEKTGGWIHHQVDRKLGQNFSTQPMCIIKNDIALQYHKPIGKTAVENNKAEVEKFAAYYLDGAARSLQTTFPAMRTYAGFKPIMPDGAIQQVTWSVDAQGFATTTASRQLEWNRTSAPEFKEHQFNQKITAALAKLEQRPKEGKRGFSR